MKLRYQHKIHSQLNYKIVCFYEFKHKRDLRKLRSHRVPQQGCRGRSAVL